MHGIVDDLFRIRWLLSMVSFIFNIPCQQLSLSLLFNETIVCVLRDLFVWSSNKFETVHKQFTQVLIRVCSAISLLLGAKDNLSLLIARVRNNLKELMEKNRLEGAVETKTNKTAAELKQKHQYFSVVVFVTRIMTLIRTSSEEYAPGTPNGLLLFSLALLTLFPLRTQFLGCLRATTAKDLLCRISSATKVGPKSALPAKLNWIAFEDERIWLARRHDKNNQRFALFSVVSDSCVFFFFFFPG
jgi:hypothetical protein